MNTQYKFLKTVLECSKSGSARYSAIRERWETCPTVEQLHYCGEGELFQKGGDLNDPEIILTGKGKDYVAECEAKTRNAVISWLTLAVAAATLAATLVQLIG